MSQTTVINAWELIHRDLLYYIQSGMTDEDFIERFTELVNLSISTINAEDIDANMVLMRSTVGGNPVWIAKPYGPLKYVTLLTQTDTEAPTEYLMLLNSLNNRSLVSMAYIEEGEYRMTFSGAIASSVDKIIMQDRDIIVSNAKVGTVRLNKDESSTSVIRISVRDNNDIPADGLLNATAIELNCYT